MPAGLHNLAAINQRVRDALTQYHQHLKEAAMVACVTDLDLVNNEMERRCRPSGLHEVDEWQTTPAGAFDVGYDADEMNPREAEEQATSEKETRL